MKFFLLYLNISNKNLLKFLKIYKNVVSMVLGARARLKIEHEHFGFARARARVRAPFSSRARARAPSTAITAYNLYDMCYIMMI